jgi:hypothetical protein
MLTPTQAIDGADPSQRRALRRAAQFATALGEPVGFLRRPVPGGAVFEAVALGSARTCAVVEADGGLRFVAAPRRDDPWGRGATGARRRRAERPRPGAPVSR